MLIKAIIVDDEPKLAEVLEIKLKKFIPSVQIVGFAENVEEAYQVISQENPDLVFLDISMPGASGFALFEKYDNVPFEVIFVTGFSEFALDALKVSAVDYLLKPVKTEDLVSAVKKVAIKIEQNVKTPEFDLLKHNVQNIGNQESKIIVPGSKSYDFITIKNIIRCEGAQKYTYIYLSNNTHILSSYNIGTYKDLFKNYEFFSTHKSHLINIKHIDRYLSEGLIIMSDGAQVPVSRRRKADFTQLFLKKNVIIK